MSAAQVCVICVVTSTSQTEPLTPVTEIVSLTTALSTMPSIGLLVNVTGALKLVGGGGGGMMVPSVITRSHDHRSPMSPPATSAMSRVQTPFAFVPRNLPLSDSSGRRSVAATPVLNTYVPMALPDWSSNSVPLNTSSAAPPRLFETRHVMPPGDVRVMSRSEFHVWVMARFRSTSQIGLTTPATVALTLRVVKSVIGPAPPGAAG